MAIMPLITSIHSLRTQNPEDVAVDLAPYVSQLSQKAISETGAFCVVLSGGTLIHTLRKLTQSPHKELVNWARWFIFWVDERVVPLDNPDSNYFLARNDFLSKVPIPSKNIHHIYYSPCSEAVAIDYQYQLSNRVQQKVVPLSATGFPQFDLMLLGIGPDGHVASLFPNRTERYNRTDWVTYINDSPKPPPKRITFTFPVINSAKHIAMVVTGKEEANAVAITLEKLQVRPPLPCSWVEPQVSLTWFLDRDAASKLPPNFNKK
ncbi:probable 6-phosphogluconolactonase 5, chloroplastic [Sesamum indicum]|uniref:Probable 6-phosphogluconolactonase n=1 Tax=Sesamum indicum TaxID=4182 RepID=A0A8M8UZ13_SESIN|nr:probable 6-phosphogluconolactonase 5, chloroplastic [Sesamum indicum]